MKAKSGLIPSSDHANMNISTVRENGRFSLRCDTSHKWDSLTKEGANRTDFETISVILGVITLIIASISLLLKLFVYLDSRYKNK